MLDIDTAIKHCLEVAEQNETQADKIGRQFIGSAMDKCATDCRECAADHRQLAEWLQELKELRRLVDLVSKYAGKSEDICERYLPSIDGDLCVTDGMGASNCTCCGYEYRCDYKN